MTNKGDTAKNVNVKATYFKTITIQFFHGKPAL